MKHIVKSTQKAEAGRWFEFGANLVNIASFRTARGM